MAGRVFDPERPAWRLLGGFADLLLLSMLWLLCCLPVLTAGAATAALYDAVARGLARREPDPYGRFFRCFKAELPRGALCVLLWGGLIAGGLALLGRWAQAVLPGTAGYVLCAAGYFLLLLPIGMACWAFPLLSRFRLGFFALCGTAAKLAFAQLPTTLALALSACGAVWLCLRFVVPVFLVPALLLRLWTPLVERVFRRYGVAEGEGAGQ